VSVIQGTVDERPGNRRTVRLTPTSGVWIVAVLVGAVLASRVFVAAHRPLSWAAAAVVAAVVLDPVVDLLARRIRRVPAVLLCFLVVGASVLGIAYLVFDDVEQAVDRLEESAPAAAASIEERDDRLGQLARDMDLTARADSFVAALDERFGDSGGEEVIRSTALTAPAYLAGAILTVFLMSYGPKLAGAGVAQLPSRHRLRAATFLSRATTRARHAGLLTVADAVANGVLVGLVTWSLDLPAPAAIGLLATVAGVLPHLGILLGWAPVVVLALGLESGPVAGIIAAGAVGLQVLDSLVVRRRIDRYVRIGLLAPFVVILLAHAVYGVGAALFGFAYAVFAMAVLDELVAEAGDTTTVLPGEPPTATLPGHDDLPTGGGGGADG
jgi:predicted PurR-regulated permease PerM